jgi:hypothetical protein
MLIKKEKNIGIEVYPFVKDRLKQPRQLLVFLEIYFYFPLFNVKKVWFALILNGLWYNKNCNCICIKENAKAYTVEWTCLFLSISVGNLTILEMK